MQAILNELNKIDLVHQNITRNYNILPKDFKENFSNQSIERILKDLKLLFENVQKVTNPRNKVDSIIKSTDPLIVCITLFLVFGFLLIH